MALRFMLILLLLVVVLALNIEKSSAGLSVSDDGWGISGVGVGSCNSDGTGLVGECINEDDEFGLESESTRRSLYVPRGRAKYISYQALAANRIPCGRRGRSYYNCFKMGRANPYNRGCTVATRCARDTH